MAIYGESLTIQYIAWDTVNNVPKTGDASNHTLRWVKDGTAAAPTNSPSEVDATNAPGVYKLTLTASETQCWVGTLCGKSSSSGVVIMPITLTFERLPTAAPGDTNGLPIIGVAPLTNLDAKISEVKAQTDKLQFVGTDVKATLDNEAVIVGAYATNMSPSEQIQSLGYTSARAGKLDNLDAAVSSRLKADDYTAPDNASIAAIKLQTDKLEFVGNDVKATLDDEAVIVGGYLANQSPSSQIQTLGYTAERAEKLDNLDAAISSRLDAGDYIAPDNASIAAIKGQTDKLTFDSSNNVYAIATVDVDEQAIADAVASQLPTSQVVVQPIVARALLSAGDGGVIVIDRHERLVASWQVLNVDLTGHDLRLIVYTQAAVKVAEYSGSDISISYQQPHSIVSVNGADEKTPPPGSYQFKLTSQTIDRVLLRGRLIVLDAPDAEP